MSAIPGTTSDFFAAIRLVRQIVTTSDTSRRIVANPQAFAAGRAFRQIGNHFNRELIRGGAYAIAFARLSVVLEQSMSDLIDAQRVLRARDKNLFPTPGATRLEEAERTVLQIGTVLARLAIVAHNALGFVDLITLPQEDANDPVDEVGLNLWELFAYCEGNEISPSILERLRPYIPVQIPPLAELEQQIRLIFEMFGKEEQTPMLNMRRLQNPLQFPDSDT